MATNPDEPSCPKCAAPRVEATTCPRCGVIYAKADARAAALAAPEQLPPAFELPSERTYEPILPVAATPTWDVDADEAELEYRLRLAAIPVALIAARLLVGTNLGRFLGRTFLSMWVHETGHAVTAWFCGYSAFPGPWFTPVWPERSIVLPFALAAALGYGAYRSWKAERRVLAGLAACGIVFQLVGTLGLHHDRAQALIMFGGDAGCLVLGTALMTSFYAGRHTAIHRGWLRWGFLVIGAVSFMDAFEQWWASRSDFDRIPFGEIEGVGLSDASKLTENYGWSTTRLVNSYAWLGLACLAVLAAFYAWGLVRARRERRAPAAS